MPHAGVGKDHAIVLKLMESARHISVSLSSLRSSAEAGVIGLQDLAIALQALVATAVFFVWVVRYQNIVLEFKQWKLPDWLRDSVGIVKLTLSLMLLIGIDRRQFAIAGGIGLSLLMVVAFMTHLRVRNPVGKMLPSLTLLTLSVLIVLINYRLRTG